MLLEDGGRRQRRLEAVRGAVPHDAAKGPQRFAVPLVVIGERVEPALDRDGRAQPGDHAPLRREDIVWTYAGVRPLYDDQAADPSAVTRDYRLELAAGANIPPLLTIMGGKVTTYRRLALEALQRLAPYLPAMGPAWTESTPLPGGDMPDADFDTWLADLQRRLPGFDPAFLHRLARRHGTATLDIVGDARDMSGLGRDFGAGLTEREVIRLRDREWARTAEDVLWRRTKIGLHLPPSERDTAARAIDELLAKARPATLPAT